MIVALVYNIKSKPFTQCVRARVCFERQREGGVRERGREKERVEVFEKWLTNYVCTTLNIKCTLGNIIVVFGHS